MQFTIDHTCPHSDARTGVIKTAHGDIQTPVFMPVGTAGAIKAVTMEQMEQETDARIILGNTY
ncbi:tRNA-guanine transglycosylase, partial [Porphyromonas uenonis]